jgi:hypothetical protein
LWELVIGERLIIFQKLMELARELHLIVNLNPMKQDISLSIPKPCDEKWENLTHTTHGGFCSSCNKTVIDFKTASDNEILEFFKNKPAHACGRFRADQLKTYSMQNSIPSIIPGFGFLKAGMASLLLLLVSKPSSAQIKSEPPRTEISNSKSIDITVNNNEARTISGRVLSLEDGSPLPGVNVLLKGSTVGTITDSNGHFLFPQKLNEGEILVFCFIGLETKEYRVPKESKDPAEIKMFYLALEWMGTVAVTDVYSEPSGVGKLWSKVKSIF